MTTDMNRRGFLALLGISTAVAAIPTPVKALIEKPPQGWFIAETLSLDLTGGKSVLPEKIVPPFIEGAGNFQIWNRSKWYGLGDVGNIDITLPSLTTGGQEYDISFKVFHAMIENFEKVAVNKKITARVKYPVGTFTLESFSINDIKRAEDEVILDTHLQNVWFTEDINYRLDGGRHAR